MAETTTKPPCAVCGGNYREHFDEKGSPARQHIYTEKEGDLTTPQEAAKRVAPQETRIPFNPASLGQAPLGKLVEVLLENRVITQAEALYSLGVGSKPLHRSGYADPFTEGKVSE